MANAELKLLNDVELKIALAQTATQLSQVLHVYLCPLLKKAASPDRLISAKVISLCNAINGRLTEDVVLPLEALLIQFAENDKGLVSHLNLLYLKRAIVATTTVRDDWLRVLLCDLRCRTLAQQRIIFRLVLHVAENLAAVQNQGEAGLSSADEEYIVQKLLDLMLLDLAYLKIVEPSRSISATNTDWTQRRTIEAANSLAPDVIEFLTHPSIESWSVPGLRRARSGVLRTFCSENSILQQVHRYLLLQFAMNSIEEQTAKYASRQLHECHLVVEDELTVARIYDCLQRRPKLNAKIRTRLHSTLRDSKVAAQQTERLIELFRQELLNSNLLSLSVLSLLENLSAYSTFSDAQRANFISSLNQYLSTQSSLLTNGILEQFCNCAATLLCLPGNMQKPHILILQELVVQAMRIDEAQQQNIIWQCLHKVSHTFRTDDKQLRIELLRELNMMVKSGHGEVAKISLSICRRSFDFYDAAARWLCILTTAALYDDDIRNLALKSCLNPVFCQEDYTMKSGGKPNVLTRWPDVIDLLKLFKHEYPFATDYTDASSIDPNVLSGLCRLLRLCLSMCPPSSIFIANRSFSVHQIPDHLPLTMAQKRSVHDGLHNIGATDQINSTNYLDLVVQCFLSVYIQTLNITDLDRLTELLSLVSTRLCPATETSLVSLCHSHLEQATSTSYAVCIRAVSLIQYHIHDDRLVSWLNHLCTSNTIFARFLMARTKTWQRLDSRPSSSRVIETLSSCVNLNTAKMKDSPSEIRELPIADLATLSRDLNIATQSHAAEYSSINDLILAALPNEACYQAIGFFQPQRQLFKLLDDPKTADVAQIIAIGHAIAGWIGGIEAERQKSQLMQDLPFQMMVNFSHSRTIDKELLDILVNTLIEYTKQEALQKRYNACVWLLCIVHDLREVQVAQTFLDCAHSAFMAMLSYLPDQLKLYPMVGLCWCYAYAHSALQHHLIRSLTQNFPRNTAGNRSSSDVIDAASLFPVSEDTGPAQGEKEAFVLTIELCHIASSCGSPSLVYAMLELAYRSQFLDTPLGHDLRQEVININIAELPIVMQGQLFIKLYCYRFFPDQHIAHKMSTIYDGLFAQNGRQLLRMNSSKMLSDYINMTGSRNWANRMSALSALEAVMLTNVLQYQVLELQEHLWSCAIQLMDDTRESIRRAAMHFARKLLQRQIRAIVSVLQVNQEKHMGTLDSLLSIFLSFITANVEDVRNFAIEGLSEIVRTKELDIRPRLPNIIGKLISSSEVVEPELLNYLSFHTSKYDITQAQLDSARVMALQQSALLTTLETCMKLLDETSIGAVTTVISTIIRQNPSTVVKLTTSRLIISLVSTSSALSTSTAGPVIQAYSSILLFDHGLGQQANVAAVGYLARTATVDKIVKLCKFLSTKYFQATHCDMEAALPLTLSAIVQYANDRANAMNSILLPLLFLCKQEPTLPATNLFQTAWDRLTASDASVRGYIPELLELVRSLISSRVWRTRATCCFALLKLTQVVPQMDRKSLLEIAALCDANLARGAWDGKRELYGAVVNATCRLQLNRADAQNVASMLIMELASTDLTYKSFMLDLLERHLVSYDKSQELKSLQSSLQPIMLELTSQIKLRPRLANGSEEPSASSMIYQILSCHLTVCSVDDPGERETLFSTIEQTLASTLISNNLQSNCALVQKLCTKMGTGTLNLPQLDLCWSLIRLACQDRNLQANRRAGITACKALLGKCAKHDFVRPEIVTILQELQSMQDIEESTSLKDDLGHILAMVVPK